MEAPKGSPLMEDIPTLPSDTGISYLDEGAANIVYRLTIRHPTPPPSVLDEYSSGTPPPTEIDCMELDSSPTLEMLGVFDNKLLRLRKNLPTTAPVEVAQQDWLRLIRPLFTADQLVDQQPVLLGANVIPHLNKELHGWEEFMYPLNGSPYSNDSRPTKRHGIYLADDPFGLLVTAMMPGPPGEELIEFKPKWLSQSPTAPSGSRRCRTCAKQAQENAERVRGGASKLLKCFCPLDLVSDNMQDLAHVSSIMEGVPAKRMRLQRWLKHNTLLRRLRDTQREMDSIGVFRSDPSNEKFRTAMTLRDCTVFLRMPADEKDDDNTEARLGDLDIKSPDKVEYWSSIERRLIDEGWYMGLEKESDRQPLTCNLSNNRFEIAKDRDKDYKAPKIKNPRKT